MAAAYCRRALLIAPRLHGANRVGSRFASRAFSDVVEPRPLCDIVSPDCKRLILVDTLALVNYLFTYFSLIFIVIFFYGK